MIPVLVLGAGKVGSLIAALLADSGSYEVHLADIDSKAALAGVEACAAGSAHAHVVDAADPAALDALLARYPVDALICGLPYYHNVAVAEAARRAGCHYLDLTEDVAVAQQVRRIAQGAAEAFVPQCGLAPGFVSIAAGELIEHFEEPRAVKLRVGALPQHPSNGLKYSLTWSTEGLINEYGNPCEAIIEGRRVQVVPLEGLEEIAIDGASYEAFNTSGGLGSLGETYGARCRHMDYKTMRYPGHCAQMRLLMNELQLNQDRGTLKRILENALPRTLQDVVLIYVAVCGMQDGQFREESYVARIYPRMIAGRLWSAIQVTTAAGVCAVLDLLVNAEGRYRGFVRQEDFRLAEVLQNRFGSHYAAEVGKELAGRMIAAGRGARQRSA